MKKLSLTILFLLITNSAYAGSCPMLWGEIDGKLDEIKKIQ